MRRSWQRRQVQATKKRPLFFLALSFVRGLATTHSMLFMYQKYGDVQMDLKVLLRPFLASGSDSHLPDHTQPTQALSL
eukprot:1154595-Pelagomonas_calceolata.AAC.7